MGAPSKRAKKTRHAAEFDRLRSALATPAGSGVPLTSWTLEQIFAARDDQMRGHFYRPARMAEAMRTDDALSVALENRLAPLRCTKVEIKAARDNSQGLKIQGEAEASFGQKGVAVHPDTLASVHACLVNHDVAIGHIGYFPREDGSRVDLELKAWPIEHVRWDAYRRQLMTRVDAATAGEIGVGGEVPIVHGDGRWLVFQRYEIDPWKHGAILAAAPVWARHAYGVRDWAKSSVAHGVAKVVGEMPAGVALQDADGATPEAAAMIELLQALISSDSPFGLRPAGSKTEFISNGATAWQIFSELVGNGEKAAARIYLGTDGTLGANGGAPGVDIQSLFGVASTKVESDVACISRGLQTMIEIWTAINFGDSSLAPTRRYMLPDADADAARASEATRTTAFYDEIARAKKGGFAITQPYVDEVAEKHGIKAPTLAVKPAGTTAARAPGSAPRLRAG